MQLCNKSGKYNLFTGFHIPAGDKTFPAVFTCGKTLPTIFSSRRPNRNEIILSEENLILMLIYCCWTLLLLWFGENMSKWCFTSTTAELNIFQMWNAFSGENRDKTESRLTMLFHELAWDNIAPASWSMTVVWRGDAFGERNEVDLWENGLTCIVTWCEWPLLGRLVFWTAANELVLVWVLGRNNFHHPLRLVSTPEIWES